MNHQYLNIYNFSKKQQSKMPKVQARKIEAMLKAGWIRFGEDMDKWRQPGSKFTWNTRQAIEVWDVRKSMTSWLGMTCSSEHGQRKSRAKRRANGK